MEPRERLLGTAAIRKHRTGTAIALFLLLATGSPVRARAGEADDFDKPLPPSIRAPATTPPATPAPLAAPAPAAPAPPLPEAPQPASQPAYAPGARAYTDLDVESGEEQRDAGASSEEDSVTSRWWFWAAIGGVLTASVAIIVLANQSPEAPDSTLGDMQAFRNR